MREAAHGIALRAAGKGTSLAGSVRITASEVVAQHHLPSMMATIRRQEPQIAIDVVPSDETTSLHYREADIAIRMYRPKQLDLIAQQIGHLSIVACAARTYLKRKGEPKTLPELLHHDLVGMDRHTAIIDGFRLAGVQLDRESFKARTDDSATYLALVRAGCGIGFAQRAVVAKYSDLTALKLPLGVPPLTVWLTAHEAIRHTPRVSRVWSLLETELRKVVEPTVRRKK
jgi:DNA-binding transcriptional LysR family regulator